MKDIYQSITNTIITALETGTPPWVCPWHSGAMDHLPANLASGRRYRGINVLLLNLQARRFGYACNRWLTFQQARSLGGKVRKGEHGTEVVLFKLHEVESTSQLAGANRNEQSDRKVIPLLRSFNVFNVAQIIDLPPALVPAPVTVQEWQACDTADAILVNSGASITHGGARAFYSPAEDRIQLPERQSFANATGYYQVALHELTHWTGAAQRCNRPLLGRQHIEAYAFEELVAEMGSAFLTDHCGLPGVLQHASYIESWLTALRNDKRLIFSAASQAQRAADFVSPKASEPIAAAAEVLAAA